MKTRELLPEMDKLLTRLQKGEAIVEDTRDSILDLLEIALEVTPHSIEWHREFFKDLLHPEIRRSSDNDLETWLAYIRREIVENQENENVMAANNAMCQLLQDEKTRRERLAAYGAPDYKGKDGANRATVQEIKAYFLGSRFLDIFQAVSGVPAGFNRGMKVGQYLYSCPLHGDGQDRNPSGHIYADEGRYWCFGCNTGGDVFKLYADFQHINFAQAIELLAREIPNNIKKERK